ncbi:MAG: 30S ribosomal protein S9, partial [Opitutales bacterium]|nr:30S ribosomal protein S9 [Opitutales bacterium]
MAEENSVYLGTGRRKTAVARIRLTEGSGQVVINGKSVDDFFSHENFSRAALLPLVTIEAKEKFDVKATVQGGGDSGQAGALALGIAR